MSVLKSNREAIPGDRVMPALSAWDILAGLGDSLAVMDSAYRIVWAREPLLPEGRSGERNPIVDRFCYEAFFGRDEVCESACPVKTVWATGRTHAVERRIVLEDGRVLWREARAYPILDRRGRVLLVARISFDISHRKERQGKQIRRLAALERSLEELNRSYPEPRSFPTVSGRALTMRELEVLRLVSQGLSKPHIAEVLNLSPHTVKRHVDNIFDKLGVNDRTQAAVWAARQGLV